MSRRRRSPGVSHLVHTPVQRLLVLLLLAGCAPSNSPKQAVLQSAARDDCGLRPALLRHLPQRPGSQRTPVESGDAIRACGLPTLQDIEFACESEEAVPIPGSRSTDDPDSPQYEFPEFAVTDPQCTFLDAGESRASCRFDLARSGAPQSRVRAELVFRFRDLSNAVVHDWYNARWEVDAVCRP